MVKHYLDFEKPLVDLEREIEHLRRLSQEKQVHFDSQLRHLEERLSSLQKDIFSNLNAWQVTQLAKHINRPKSLYYIQGMFEDFIELHGDRTYGDDPAIVGGFCKLDGRPLLLIGQQKGGDAREMVYRNFGMAHPEGYRKALRLMRMAETFKKPVVTLVDTPGAYPGAGAEERGQAEAIARNLIAMSVLRTPILTIIIGEGGSGGALAIGVGDRVLMLEYSVYSVVSPKACASILWRDGEKEKAAAESLKLTAQDLFRLGVIDEVVKEPLGGAHRNPQEMAETLKARVVDHLRDLETLPTQKLLNQRYEKFRRIGNFIDEGPSSGAATAE